ncbi:CRE-IST-1 protein [Caenorhabditis remanei]|uniref:CRE-IST-1 protein n=1 Tax=Caenorhabditis remanei TaxID=31234 RepID=E3LD51_CAERE|nr:CRE-IST-1 protein [Caenorhabditis remanei]
MLPAIEPPKEEKRFQGEYVETYFGDPDGVKEDAPGPNYVELAAKVTPSMREERIRESKLQGQMKERRMKNPEARKDLHQEKALREAAKQMKVEDLPKDEDPDEFGIEGVYKCGNCLVGFAPVKKKKLMFVTLTERCLELHDSEKAYRAGKSAKHMVDLAMSFNVHSEHYDAKLKKCLCLMGPDETICMRPEGGILTIEGWRRAITKAIHDARRRKMDREPRPEDMFDAAYDIRICPSTKNAEKYQSKLKKDGMINICTIAKELAGKKRLCLFPHSLAIVDLCIEPTAYGLPPAGFPPYRTANMFILERSTIAYYGHRDEYFFMRIGKGSPYRGYEILFQVENNDVCKEIYTRIRHLAERDVESRKQEMARRAEGSDMHGMESLSVPSPLLHRTKLSLDTPVLTARDRRLMLGRDSLSFASLERDDSAPSSPFANYNRPRGSLGNFQIDHLSRPRAAFPSVKQAKEETGLREVLFESYAQMKKKNSTQSERGEILIPDQERKMSDNRPRRRTQDEKDISRPEKKSLEPTRPRLPPLKFNANKPSGEFLIALQREKELLEEAKRNGSDGKPTNPDGNLRQVKKDFLDVHGPPPLPPDVGIVPKQLNSDYTLMGPGDWNKMEELKDDYSDSGDSCYSSRRGTETHRSRPIQPHLACQMPNRAQSFGAKQLKFSNRLPPTVNLPDSERKISAAVQSTANQLDLPEDDPRKRAFSLGSRNFFSLIGFTDFRRLVSKRHRTTSPNHTSTSGISLNSSNPSPSASSNFLASAEYLEHTRTESFGSSARSSPSKGYSSYRTTSPKRKSDDDLVSIDFSKLGKKNSITEMKRSPFGGGGPGGSFDYDRQKREKEENDRNEREQKAMDLKRKEEMEARELAAKKREAERKIQEKKERKLEKEREKERQKEKDREYDQEKDFRPKADSGIADCTPGSSFSGKKDGKGGDSSYVDAEGLRFLADIKKRKKEQEALETTTSSSSSLSTIVSLDDNKTARKTTKTAETTTTNISKAIGAVDINRRSSTCAELNRKPSICTAIMEEKEGEASETESKGEPSDKKTSAAPVTRKTASTGSSMSPFRRLKFLSFRKN